MSISIRTMSLTHKYCTVPVHKYLHLETWLFYTITTNQPVSKCARCTPWNMHTISATLASIVWRIGCKISMWYWTLYSVHTEFCILSFSYAYKKDLAYKYNNFLASHNFSDACFDRLKNRCKISMWHWQHTVHTEFCIFFLFLQTHQFSTQPLYNTWLVIYWYCLSSLADGVDTEDERHTVPTTDELIANAYKLLSNWSKLLRDFKDNVYCVEW